MTDAQGEQGLPPAILKQLTELEDAINEEVSLAIHEFHAAEGAVVINPITRRHALNILKLFKPYLVANAQTAAAGISEIQWFISRLIDYKKGYKTLDEIEQSAYERLAALRAEQEANHA